VRYPSALFRLKPILDDDPRFDGFVFDIPKPTPEVQRAYQAFEIENALSIHWQPRRFSGEWTPLPVAGPTKPFNDYPCLNLLIPVYSRRAIDALGSMLTDNGQLLALQTEIGDYFGYVGFTKIDALDLSKSRLRRKNPEERSDLIEYFWFTVSKLADATIFRIPESPNTYFVTERFKDRIEQAKLNGFNFVPVWPLPEDSDWMMEETYRRRARKGTKIKIVGEALMLRFLLQADQPSERERFLAKAMEQSLRERLAGSLAAPYMGSIEAVEFEAGEFRVFCICPDCEELEKFLQPWLMQVEWPDGIVCVRRYGNLYVGRAKERSIEVRKPSRPVAEPHWLKARVESRLQRQMKVKAKEKAVKSHSESDLVGEMPQQIKDSALEALSMLRLDEHTEPQAIMAVIDQFVYDWQCGQRPPIPCEAEDLPYTLGSLWGEQLTRQFGWEWKTITFHEHGDTQAPGVVSPDRSLVVYPIHFIIGCMANPSIDATILLSFKMLAESTAKESSEGRYANLMEQVFRIVPRIASLDTERK